MDPRLLALLARQQATSFAGLTGSDVRAALRVSAPLLNEAVAAYTAAVSAVRELIVTPRAGNRFDVQVKLAMTFLPPIHTTVLIERQPQLPADPTLVLRLTGAAGMMRLAGSAVNSFGKLPPGVRLVGDHVYVDLREVLRARGQDALLTYAQDLAIGTEEGTLLVLVHARVP